jgi:hypothetical protein
MHLFLSHLMDIMTLPPLRPGLNFPFIPASRLLYPFRSNFTVSSRLCSRFFVFMTLLFPLHRFPAHFFPLHGRHDTFVSNSLSPLPCFSHFMVFMSRSFPLHGPHVPSFSTSWSLYPIRKHLTVSYPFPLRVLNIFPVIV